MKIWNDLPPDMTFFTSKMRLKKIFTMYSKLLILKFGTHLGFLKLSVLLAFIFVD